VIILVTGGSRSGKSGFALSLAEDRGGPRVFLATAQAFDDEMRDRIAAHRRARPAGWGLVEEPRAVPEALRRALGQGARTVLVDCVTIWMSNLLLTDEGFGERGAAQAAEELVAAARGGAPGGAYESASSGDVIIVTNEVGSGVVPDNALARRFRDCAGRANQLIAQAADEVYFLVSGIPMRIKPGKGRE
jgi:adenosylcobinamide kinase/adenosylcobinamide-phosphate guanylyltransferase